MKTKEQVLTEYAKATVDNFEEQEESRADAIEVLNDEYETYAHQAEEWLIEEGIECAWSEILDYLANYDE